MKPRLYSNKILLQAVTSKNNPNGRGKVRLNIPWSITSVPLPHLYRERSTRGQAPDSLFQYGREWCPYFVVVVNETNHSTRVVNINNQTASKQIGLRRDVNKDSKGILACPSEDPKKYIHYRTTPCISHHFLCWHLAGLNTPTPPPPPPLPVSGDGKGVRRVARSQEVMQKPTASD